MIDIIWNKAPATTSCKRARARYRARNPAIDKASCFGHGHGDVYVYGKV